LRFYKRHHRLVWVAVGLNVAFMLAFALLVPPFHGPDEPAHFDMIHQYQRDPLLRKPEQRLKFVIVGGPIDRKGRVLSPAPYGIKRARLRVKDASPRSERPTLGGFGTPKPVEYNQMTQHPPLYYLVMAAATAVITVPNELWTWDREMLLARWLSVLFVAPLALLASEAMLALGLTRRVGAIAAAFTVLIPGKTFIGSVVNNDSLAMLFAGICVVAALRFMAGGTVRSAWVAAASAAALALTKSTGAVVAVWVVFVIAFGAYERWKRGEKRDAKRALLPSAGLIAVGTTWYLANVVQFGRPQPHPRRILGDTVPSSFGKFFPQFLDLVSRTFWGQPARRLGIGLPWWVSHSLSVLMVAAVIAAFITAVSLRRYLVVLVALCAGQGAALLQATWATNRVHNRGFNGFTALQGRYLYPMLVALAAIVAIACYGVFSRFSQRAVLASGVVILAVGAVLHVALGMMMLDGYWQGSSLSHMKHLHAVVAWSPLPQLVTVAILALPFVVFAIGIAVSVTSLRSETGRSGTGQSDVAPVEIATT